MLPNGLDTVKAPIYEDMVFVSKDTTNNILEFILHHLHFISKVDITILIMLMDLCTSMCIAH